MTIANYGSVFSCCIFGSLMMLYLYLFCRNNHFILKNGTFVIYLGIGIVIVRLLLPWNFEFSQNIESHKILPFIFDLLKTKILSVEFLTIIVVILTVGSCFRLALYFYRFFSYHHLLHQLNPLDDPEILGIFSNVLEEFHCNRQIKLFHMPGLSSPAVAGLFRPVILLPDRQYTKQDLHFIFMHELNHYLHHDLWKSFFCELIVCIYWWNPLAYMMRRQIKDTAEHANDISLTKDMDELTRTDYMLSLLKTSKQTHTFYALPTLHYQEGTLSSLEKRCELISSYSKTYKNSFSQFLHIAIMSVLFILSICFVFQPVFEAPTHDVDGAVVFDKPDSSNSFYVKRKDGKGYDLYVKQKDTFINTGIINNPDDFKGPKVYSSKKEALKHFK